MNLTPASGEALAPPVSAAGVSPAGDSAEDALAKIEEAIVLIVREASLTRVQERFVQQSGVGLDRAAYGVLREVAERGSPRLTDLAHHLGLDVSTVSRHVKSLTARGLLVRRGDPADRRAACVGLSAAGVDALSQLREARRRFFSDLLVGWEAADREILAPLLGRLAHDFLAMGGRL